MQIEQVRSQLRGRKKKKDRLGNESMALSFKQKYNLSGLISKRKIKAGKIKSGASGLRLPVENR